MRNYTINVPFTIGKSTGLYQAELSEERVRKLYEETYYNEFPGIDDLTTENWEDLGATLHDMLACALEESTTFFDIIFDIL